MLTTPYTMHLSAKITLTPLWIGNNREGTLTTSFKLDFPSQLASPPPKDFQSMDDPPLNPSTLHK